MASVTTINEYTSQSAQNDLALVEATLAKYKVASHDSKITCLRESLDAIDRLRPITNDKCTQYKTQHGHLILAQRIGFVVSTLCFLGAIPISIFTPFGYRYIPYTAGAIGTIENETFNTLKNQGYHFEHNFGHGNKNLCTVMSFLMVLAFLIDQLQLISCEIYQQAKKAVHTFASFWEKMRTFFSYLELSSWERFFGLISRKIPIDTS